MIVINFTEARKSLRSFMDRVVEDTDCTVIARGDAQNAVVISVNHYNA